MSGFFGVPVGAAYHLVFALTNLLTPVAGGLAAVAAIVLFTAAVRLLISPLSLRALRGQAAMTRLAPQVHALRARHARQPERLQRELAALYKREGTSPFASLLPVLAQWPFLTVTYLLFRSATVNGTANQLLSHGLFGVPLGAHWLSGAGLFSVHGAVFVAVLAVIALVCWLSARLARLSAPVQALAPRGASQPAGSKPRTASRSASRAASRTAGTSSARAGKAGARSASDPAEALAGSRAVGAVTRLLPYMTVVIAAFAPLAAAVYLLTTTAWTLAERRVFLRRTARAAAIPVAKVA